MIHDTAIIDPNAQIGKNVEIGPFCIIGPNVKIRDNNKLQSKKHEFAEVQWLSDWLKEFRVNPH